MLMSTESKAPSRLSWRARWVRWRNRLLASPGFQHWASRFPLTRPVAQRRAAALFDLIAGFVYAQVTAALVESGLIDRLVAGCTSEEAAIAADLPVASAERLLRAAAALDLAESVDGRWLLGQTGAALQANAGARAMIAHHRLLYADLADPLAVLRRGRGSELNAFWAYAAEAQGAAIESDDVRAYSQLMAASQPMVAEQVTRAYPFARHRRMLDVGGGEGAFLTAVHACAPALELGLFDLPAVVARASLRLVGEGIEGVGLHGGSFVTDPLPRGYDLITLVRVLHDHDDDVAETLLARAYAALPPGGTLLIAEPMAETSAARAMGDAYFGFYLLAMGSGRPRAVAELSKMLRSTGFAEVRQHATRQPLIASVVVATK